MKEVYLLKVLQAPTIISDYNSKVEDNKIQILMEYAPEGSLFDLIEELRR